MARKNSDYYASNHYVAELSNGKYFALCTICNKRLSNTAKVRLQIHRKSCNKRSSRYNSANSMIQTGDLTSIEKILPDRPESIVGFLGDGYIQEHFNSGNCSAKTENMEPFEEILPERLEVNEQKQQSDRVEIKETKNKTGTSDVANFESLNELNAEKLKAQIEHFHSETKYYQSELENISLERSVTLLKIKKLRMDIATLQDVL